MSNEEAINRIMQHMTIHKMNEPRAIKISMALQKAMYSLDKQIPKKVKYDEYGREEGYPHCPNCGKTLINDLVGATYCCDCGQKLDWNEGGKE